MEYFIYFILSLVLIMTLIWGFFAVKDFLEEIKH